MPICRVCNQENLLILRATGTCSACNDAMNESKVRGARVQTKVSNLGSKQYITVKGEGQKALIEYIQTNPAGNVLESCILQFEALDLIYGLSFEMTDEQIARLKAHVLWEEERRYKAGKVSA